LRVVHSAPPPPSQPKRTFEVRVHLHNGNEPWGISRAFRLTPSDLNRLAAIASEMEAWQ
jgi:hypothetical protein